MKDPCLYAVELQDESHVLSNNLNGRHLILRFIGGNNPQLDRIEFQWNATSKPTYWQQGDKVNAMSWTKVPQALSILFLDYLGEGNPVGPVYLSETNGGDLAKALGNAISDKGSKLHELFVERQPKSLPFSRVKQVFGGKNIHGKDVGGRRICVQIETLPTDCVEVYWMFYGQERITDVGVFREIANRIRKDLGIPIGEAIPIEVKEPVQPTTPPPSAPPVTSPVPPQIALQHPYFQQQPRIIKQEISFPRSFVQTLERIANAVDRPQQQSQPDDYQQPPPAKESARRLVNPFPPSPPPPPIPSYLFSISQIRDGQPDGTPLIYLDDENEDSCPWTVRNAFEGVMILGATGSGKNYRQWGNHR